MCGMLKLTVGSTLIAWFVGGGGGEWGNQFHKGFGVLGLPKGLGNPWLLGVWNSHRVEGHSFGSET